MAHDDTMFTMKELKHHRRLRIIVAIVNQP
jgi:hypothetical protein